MILKDMLSEHVAEVKTLLDTCFGEGAWSPEMIQAELIKPESRCTVAVEGERLIGYLAFEQIADEGSVIEVAVHPDYRRQGVARQMLTSAMNNAENIGAVFLEVRESNVPAIALYESMGFEKIGIRKDYYDKPKENGLIYQNSRG